MHFLLTSCDTKSQRTTYPRVGEISTMFLPLDLTPILIDKRKKLLFLAATIAAAFARVTINGGYVSTRLRPHEPRPALSRLCNPHLVN